MTTDDTVLVLIDVQGKLAEAMDGRERLYDALQRLVKGCRVLELPVIWMEQIPDKMGPTIDPLRELLAEQAPISKCAFSCFGEPAFLDRLKTTGRTNVLLAGIETHVCVYQTARDLVDSGCVVQVVADATSSRTAENRAIGLERIRSAGASITSVETILFELMRTAEHPAFRDILRIVK